MIQVKPVKECPLVEYRYEPNGHDCWGNYEFSQHTYVTINGKSEDVFSNELIIYDDETNKVLATAYDWNLKDKLNEVKGRKPKPKPLFTLKDLEKAFNDGVLYGRDELELNTKGKKTVFDAYKKTLGL